MKKILKHTAFITAIIMILTCITAASLADGYQIYRAASKNGTYKRIATTGKLTYVNKGLSVGKSYYYKVRAYKNVGSSKKYGKFSAAKRVQMTWMKPKALVTMPETLTGDTLSFTLENPQKSEELYFIAAMPTELMAEPICFLTIPGAVVHPEDAALNNIAAFEIVSLVDSETGEALQVYDLDGEILFVSIEPGQSVTITGKYLQSSTADLSYGIDTDILGFYIVYKDVFYAGGWSAEEGTSYEKVSE